MADQAQDTAASIAQSEAQINSYGAKTGTDRKSDSALESGVNENVESHFPGATVQVGGTRRGENPVLPDEAGGEFNKFAGRQTRAQEFEGRGGPEDKVKLAERDRPGDDDVTGTNR